MISDAIGLERISSIVGYIVVPGDFSTTTPNLPQRIAVFAEANTANQATLDTDGFQITSAQEAGERYGWGSPVHIIARILLSSTLGGVGGIPVIVYPQAEAGGATAKILEITPSGTATANGTHTVVIAGRSGMEGDFYNVNINVGDTTEDITAKISDAVNNILGSPVIATDDSYTANLTSKWAGLTADGLSVTIDDNGNSLGITYVVNSIQSGSGTPSISGALDQFGANWITLVVNSYGTQTDIMDALEEFNGIPNPVTPTGRYRGIIMKPFVAITGTVAEDPSAISDARLNDVTIAFAPAPLSDGLAMEAAANMCVLAAVIAQNNPHLDVSGLTYPDMPTPTVIGDMSDYDKRDQFVKKGCSTVDLVAGQYIVKDFVTTYHKLGETPPQFRYVRNLVVDANVRYAYYLLEQKYVVNHAIAADNDVVTADKVIKPKQWVQILSGESFTGDLAKRALIVDVPFTKASIKVGLGTANPDRFETAFKYKRSGFVRQAATTAEAGFNFGTLN